MYIIYTHDFLDLYILVPYTHTSIFVCGLILQPVYKNKFSRLRTPDSCILTPFLAGKPPSYIIAQSNRTFPRNDWNISRNWPFPCAPVSKNLRMMTLTLPTIMVIKKWNVEIAEPAGALGGGGIWLLNLRRNTPCISSCIRLESTPSSCFWDIEATLSWHPNFEPVDAGKWFRKLGGKHWVREAVGSEIAKRLKLKQYLEWDLLFLRSFILQNNISPFFFSNRKH